MPHLPADLTFRRVCRTGNRWTVAEETVVGLTHDRVFPGCYPASHRPTGTSRSRRTPWSLSGVESALEVAALVEGGPS